MKRNKTVLTEQEIKALAARVSLVTVAGNALLSALKLFAGVAASSGAMISDAVHSMSDILTTFAALFGVQVSKKKSDLRHPYGHERIETITSMALALILLVTGLGIGWSGLSKILGGNYDSLAVPGLLALAAAAVSIAAKEVMFWYTRHYAKLMDSPSFMADAWHHRSDAFSSVGSLIGIAGARLGFPIMDPIASLVICLFIFKVAFDILLTALKNIMDSSCGEDYERQLREFIRSQDGVMGVDLLRTRMFGNKIYVDAEISADGSKSLYKTHAIAENVHKGIEEAFPQVKHIMIHVNPFAGAKLPE